MWIGQRTYRPTAKQCLCCQQGGILSLARTLSGELVDHGIRVNGLSPGPTETPAFGKLGLAADEEEALRADIRKLVPIGRMGKPVELAKAAGVSCLR